MSGDLAFEIHALTSKLDRAADRLLRARFGISYRRFLALFLVEQLGVGTQRELADALDVSEPSVSRMAGVLANEGLLVAEAVPGANRRRVALTDAGRALVADATAFLSEHLAAVVQRSGIPVAAYLRHTRRLSTELDRTEQAAAAR